MDGQDGSFPFCLSIIFRPWDDHDDPTTWPLLKLFETSFSWLIMTNRI
jgi:hypothetical protein